MPTNPASPRPCSFLARSTTLACLLLAAQSLMALERVDDFGNNPGDLAMYVYRPADSADSADAVDAMPLVIALHGCRQTAAGFDDETGLTALADEVPFMLLLPEQRERNMARRCFRWYDTRDNQPGRGESASILAMLDKVLEDGVVDATRVHVLGLSAGGAMAAVLMANYPERFAGGAILAGLPYGCNRPRGWYDFTWNWLHYNPFAVDGADASYACGIAGFGRADRDAEDWASYVLRNLCSPPAAWPRVSIWQGAADGTVDPRNLRELREQWTTLHGIDAVADDEQRIGQAIRQVYRDSAGQPLVETWWLEGFDHAVPIDTDGVPDRCGIDAPYIVDADLCAVRRIAEFWQLF